MLMPWLNRAYDCFYTALNQHRLPGSVIIAGHSGYGVTDLALECAKLYLCTNVQETKPCGECKSCLVFESGSHPDFLLALPTTKEECDKDEDLTKNPGFLAYLKAKSNVQRRSIRIDTIRKLNHLLHESSAFSYRKVSIIHDAHLLGESAANALLKTFEEPPSDTLIILVVETLESLLPTLLSRAFKIELSSLNQAEILPYLQEQGFDKKRSAVALALSANAPFRALEMLNQGLDKVALEVSEALAKAITQGSTTLFVKTLSEVEGAVQVTILQNLVKEILFLKQGVSLQELPLILETHAQVLSQIPTFALFKVQENFPFIEGKLPLIPSRTPKILLREIAITLACHNASLKGGA